jgi:hypothetical protein
MGNQQRFLFSFPNYYAITVSCHCTPSCDRDLPLYTCVTVLQRYTVLQCCSVTVLQRYSATSLERSQR